MIRFRILITFSAILLLFISAMGMAHDKSAKIAPRWSGRVIDRGLILQAKAGHYHPGLGNVVMVPSRIIEEKSISQTLPSSVLIISSIATTIFIIDRL
jgi:hypothetical protein